MKDFPESYQDPQYASLDAANEQKYGLPVGLLSSIRTRGERSNASQVSSAGASSVYQFIPATRQAILDKHGIDVALNPANASEGAAILLSESLKRNKNDPAAAVGEYIGGTDRANWGSTTKAYINRVMTGQQSAKLGALSNDFAAFMAANPATPAPAPTQAPKADALSQDFGAWKAQADQKAQFPNRDYSPQIPDTPTQTDEQGRQYVDTTKPADPSFVDKALGAGEAVLSAATAGTTGYLGALAGGVQQTAKEFINGTQGDPQAQARIEAESARQAAMLSYQPRTQTGQEYAQALGENLQPLMGIAPADMAAFHAGIAPAVAAAGDLARAAPSLARDSAVATKTAVQRGAAAVTDAVKSDAAPTPGTQGSAGAAGTDIARQRQATADTLPVPIKLRLGQATRDFEQQRFERETMKDPSNGAPLRENAAQQNGDVQRNFDVMIDRTGAEAPDLRAAGQKVVGALQEDSQRMKNEIRVAYKNAEKSGELESPVTLNTLVDHLNESAPEAAVAPLLTTARSLAIKLGVATDQDGTLVAQPTTLKAAETYRQAINRSTDYEPTNVRQASIIKGAIDSQTEGLGGDMYKQARNLRWQYANRYENNVTVSKLLANKRGTNDRQVAFEDVYRHSIQAGSRDDLRHVRAVLQTSGEQGQQAWRELQGRTLAHLKEEATKNTQMDERGQPVVSAAGLNKAIKALDHDGKLDLIFGKRGAQQLRDLNEVSQVMFTAPAGSVNTSNTASVLLAALSDAGMGVVTGLPLPVVTALKVAKQYRDAKQMRAKVQQALDGIK